MAMILQTGPKEWTLERGAHTMRLVDYQQDWAKWAMFTDNPAARAWNNGRESFKAFENLAAVEAHYKSWRGISALIGDGK